MVHIVTNFVLVSPGVTAVIACFSAFSCLADVLKNVATSLMMALQFGMSCCLQPAARHRLMPTVEAKPESPEPITRTELRFVRALSNTTYCLAVFRICNHVFCMSLRRSVAQLSAQEPYRFRIFFAVLEIHIAVTTVEARSAPA